MNRQELESLRAPHTISAGDVFPFPLPALRHNEAHRAIRRGMERGGEVRAAGDGFVWQDDTWFADASVSVSTAEGNTAVTVLVDRRREALVCWLGTPAGAAAGALLVTGLPAVAMVALPLGVVGGVLLNRWARARWRGRAWRTVEALGLLAKS